MSETRHYIALNGGLHVMFKIGPAESFNSGPTEPVPLSGTLAYPVSSEIAIAWVEDDTTDSEA